MSGPAPRPLTLFLLGFFTLFLELVLIRYLAGNVWNLGYFPNLVLMGAFVGMGSGFVFHQRVDDERSPRLFACASLALLVLAVFVQAFRPQLPFMGSWESLVGGELFFTAKARADAASSSQLTFVAWFAGVVAVFALISQRTAKVFRAFPPLRAYALDVGGSCCGILAFMAISWFQAPAWCWFVIAAPLAAGALPRDASRAIAVAALLATAGLALYQDHRLLGSRPAPESLEVTWSPYQKVEYVNTPDDPYAIFVNGIGHQFMMTPQQLAGSFYTAIYGARKERKDVAPYKRVLVIGAGSGNDVAAALANGAEDVDAVEIDPVIAALGKAHHPAKPYDDPRVHLHIDDGRAFMTRTDRKYDLVVFALTDSLVKVSAMAQLRLENYLFTRESVERAYRLLTPSGDILFYNYYRQPWLVEKIARMALAATGRWPRIATGRERDFAALLVGPATGGPPPAEVSQTAMEISQDDWPFLYLMERRLPEQYAIAMGGCALVVALLLLLLRLTSGGAREVRESGLRVPAAFLVMGVAFMLLETKSIIQFSLLFGTTWVNSSLVFLAVLVSVLLANALAGKLSAGRSTLWALYALLMGSCAATLVYPLGNLLGVENAALRFVAASLLTFGPIFFANCIYSLAFRESAVPEHVFGWNLLGATLGGVIEYTSMAMGYTFLAWIVAVAYTVVFFLLRADVKESELK